MGKKKKLIITKQASPRSKHRYFSEAARKAEVSEIDEGLSKAEAGRKYQVSQTSIYAWVRKYSKHYEATLKVRVEHESDSEKNKGLNLELSKAYEALGRSQAENLLLQKILELASEHFEMDLKKNFENQHLPITIKKGKSKD